MSGEQPAEEPTDGPEPGQELPPLGGDMAGEQMGPEEPTGEEGPLGQLWGLRNTDGPEPHEVGRELDPEAEWWQHAGAGFFKQVGTHGAEAWMHYAMALLLLTIDLTEADEEGSAGAGGGADHDEYHQADAGEPDESLGEGEMMDAEEFL